MNNVKEDIFILFEFHSEKSMKPKCYVAKVFDIAEEVVINYLRKVPKWRMNLYIRMFQISTPIDLEDIKALLPIPVSQGTTFRTKSGIVFSLDFRNINIQ